MADPVVIVEKIIEIAITITDAVETVRENKEECRGIEKLVRRVSDLLSLLKESEMMKHRVVGGPLKDLGDAISHAHEVVTACQGRNIFCLFCKAGKLAKKLSQVKGDISQGMMLAIFATQAASVFVATKGQQSVLNVSVFFVRTYRPPPLLKHLPSPSPPPPPVVEDHQPDLLTHEPPSHHPSDASVGNGLLPYLPAQEHASSSPIVADVPNLDPHSHGHVSPPPPPPPPPPRPRTNIAPLVSKHIPRLPPKQPPLPPPSPSPSPPPSFPLPTYATSPESKHQRARPSTPPPSAPDHPHIGNITSPLSKHLPPSPPAQLPMPPASPPRPSYPTASVDPHKTRQHPQPSSNVPPDSPPQISVEVLAPVSAPTPSAEDISSKSDERKSKPVETEEQPPPLPGLTKFSLSELKDATQNFSNQNKIGASEYGTVYKGVLHGGLKVAIKEFRDPPQFLVGRLSAKLRIASKLQSKHMDASGNNKYIIRVLGYGHECKWGHDSLETHIFLVEEYYLNGNMDTYICGPHRLHWSSRSRIILRLAQGLYYLHEQNIVHMNVKPANVLLDSNLNPKITDFGIARILEKPMIQDNNIAGTVGYMPPEYILEGILSKKYDVYSFGVTLLETISGLCKAEPARHHASVTWAWNVRENQQMEDIFDPSLFDESHLPEITRCLEIGLLCTQFEQAERPTMAEILDMLNGSKGLTTPKQPEYTKNEKFIASKGPSHKVRSRRS